MDELAVVPRQAKEAPYCTRRAGLGLVLDRLHLGGIHGDAGLGDDMPQVGDGGDPKSALRTLDEEPVLMQHGEDGTEVPKMIRPR